MNKEIEKNFVKKFIKKQYRDRSFFELSSPKKRRESIEKFQNTLDFRYEVFNGNDDDEIKKNISKTFDLSKKVYIISDDEFDGTVQDFKFAFDVATNSAGTCVLVCGENTIFVKNLAYSIDSLEPSRLVLFNDMKIR